jgi:hypothetical protein
MFVDELQAARLRLTRRAGLAAALRRQGLELTAAGYRARARTKVRMEQTKIPRDVDRLRLLWTTDQGNAVVEWTDGERLFFATVSIADLKRYDRRAGRRRNG